MMARLIDAERFECIGFQATGEQRYDDGFANGMMFMAERIDSAPTIDAIPTRWLKEYQLENLRQKNYDMVGAIETMMWDWKKETGGQTCD